MNDSLKMPANPAQWNRHGFWLCRPIEAHYRIEANETGYRVTQNQLIWGQDDDCIGEEVLRTAQSPSMRDAIIVASIFHRDEIKRCGLEEHTANREITEEDMVAALRDEGGTAPAGWSPRLESSIR